MSLDFLSFIIFFIMKLEETCFSLNIDKNSAVNSEITRNDQILFFLPFPVISCVQILIIYFLKFWKASFSSQNGLKHHFKLSKNSTEVVSLSCILWIGFLNNNRDFLKCFYTILFIWFAIEATLLWWKVCIPAYRMLLNYHRHCRMYDLLWSVFCLLVVYVLFTVLATLTFTMPWSK